MNDILLKTENIFISGSNCHKDGFGKKAIGIIDTRSKIKFN